MSSSRKALRDFYKLPDETASDTASTHGSEISRGGTPHQAETVNDAMLETEEEPLTKLAELDLPDADVAAFVQSMAETQTLPTFIATVNQIKREQASLASAQRELVNDNYKKLIKAAEMLGLLNVKGDLASVDVLKDSVNMLSQWAAKLPQTN